MFLTVRGYAGDTAPMRAITLVLYLSITTAPVFAGILTSSGQVSVGSGGSLCSSGTIFNNTLAQSTCGNGTTTGLAKMQSDYGVLKAYATYTATDEMAQTVEVLANASFTDFLSISYAGDAPASIKFTFTITGAGFSGSNAGMFFSASGSGGLVTTSLGAGTYDLNATLNAPITPGDPISLVLTSSLQAKAYYDNGSVGPWSSTATADFFSTATLSSVIVYDELSNDISGKVNITGGAASYPLGGGGGGDVPEPSTMLLTAGGAGLATVIRKRVRV
jgi:hypothetical protein